MPIGVFDSGVGGLTVAKALRHKLPKQEILYLGDTARLPYGTKSRATVTRYTERNLEFLRKRGVDAVVVACNTASALALPYLATAAPTWGVVEPGAQRASEVSRGGRIGVIATESTVRSGAYEQALRSRGATEVFSQACPLFVPLVEEGWLDDSIVEAVAHRYLAPLREAEVDTLVLGCTHYPLLKPVVQRVMGRDVELVDSAETVAELVAAAFESPLSEDLVSEDLVSEDLVSEDLGSEGLPSQPGIRIFCTDAGAAFQRTIRRILNDTTIELELVEV